MYTPIGYITPNIAKSAVSDQHTDTEEFSDDIDVYITVFDEDEYSGFADEVDWVIAVEQETRVTEQYQIRSTNIHYQH